MNIIDNKLLELSHQNQRQIDQFIDFLFRMCL
jgi:hypothetical protein